MIGGTSAEKNLLTVKLASTHFYDSLPTSGDETGRAFRDIELEKQLLQEAYKIGLGAQFGGKYMAHDVRVVRLPRHGASCPIGLGVSCSADRNIKCKINKDGIWIEKLDNNPASLIPEELRQAGEGDAVRIDLNQPMKDVCAILTKYPIGTRLSLNGTIIVGRDIAHAKIKARLDAGEAMPEYLKNHPIYYAGPAKTPAGMACGSMGPTTAGRMDPYVDEFQDHGGSLIMLAKGNRSIDVTNACQKHGGFYLGSIGGPAAILAQNNIKSIECVEYPELGMEAIWKIEVENFPAFILVDDKGNDFFKQLNVITISIIALIVLLSVLIVYTPIRNILPGYSASLRQQLIDESARVDSLQADLRLQRQYLDVIKALTAGDIQSDSVQSLDSLQRVEKVQIVSQPNEATEAFMAQYEQKERDRLMLFSSTAPRFVRQLYRPVRGIIVASPRPDHHVYGVTVHAAKNETVVATTRGTLVSVERLMDDTYAVTLQHGARHESGGR